ncbi:uncharacterized protein LOC124162698 [Ischnura elegans]|uniref:uncharacterized protein LOC124162698 n=1 Tax=Ischnura elegans TaxID=197161 RepID=UPI001ED883A4|nr:uncharacterized protein LOC124162698 [Ischnura elegans]XP_046395252.1 uncharacterized protein LOC124162698 [Ischnura elegans]XP_046395253.1 uncharacterized protein LOC124162698 [Ischnura elegans]XP_046395255.1 uncharacterized protein LOC124162698 [Ischnura elegans]XP_046395256.1 uncharacterized protein LOC124162698 [Ischnura elegans]XP_046395257.1 uncharacterized protein LOC124162698 [Ischnura elegans]
MENIVSSLMSTYMGDYNWPYIASQNYRQDGECFYYPTAYKPMDYYMNLPTQEDIQNTCKSAMTDNFAPCRAKPRRDPMATYEPPPPSSPYNNLHCTCPECMREMKCAEARVDLKERYPFIYKPESKQLTHENEMMAKIKRDRFCSVYQHSYSKDPCQLFRFHNQVPCEKPMDKPDVSYSADSPECFALQKPPNPLEFRKYPSAKTNPPRKKAKGGAVKHSSTPTETITRPWHSEYMDGISKVGGTIMNEKFHWH